MDSLRHRLHILRKQVDAAIQAVGQLKLQPNQEQQFGEQICQREVVLAYTKLQEAKMWLGKCLELAGSELPKEYQDKAE